MTPRRCDRCAFGLIPVFAFFLMPSLAAADGGAIRLSEQHGNYRITVFTAPTPLRAGAMDLSVLVQDAVTGELASEVQITVKAARRGCPGAALQHSATKDAATNKLYYAAALDLPEPGWYALEVSIAGTMGEAQLRLDVEAADPLPSWLALSPWVGWPALAVLLFSIHLLLVRRSVCGAARRENSRARPRH
jgi:hypothetical protein